MLARVSPADEETGNAAGVGLPPPHHQPPPAPSATPPPPPPEERPPGNSCCAKFLRCVRCSICCYLLILPLTALVLLAIIIAILCSPCICCCCMKLRKQVVVLDGKEKLKLNEEASKRIDAARAAPFSAKFQSDRLKASPSKIFAAESRPGVLGGDSGLLQKRGQLKATRLEERETGSKPPLPWLIIQVERKNILEQSLRCLGRANCDDLLAQRVQVRFLGEMGVDAGGLTRDWFDSLGRGLVEAATRGDGHLMVLPDNTLRPRPYDTRFGELFAIGRLVGLALWSGIPLPIPLGSVTCKFMLDVGISPVDLQRLDPDFVQFRVTPVLRPSGVSELEEALCEPLTFVSAATELRASQELCPGGETKRVTEENKHEYLRLLCEHHLCGDMQEQIKVLLAGFWDMFPKDILTSSGISHRELALLISGCSDLDVDEWCRHTIVTGTPFPTELLTWFWEMVAEMPAQEKASLLHFVTGSSRLPASGFAGIRPQFEISVQGVEPELLPAAHTCGNQLVLPRYTSKRQLVEKTKIALANDEGFGFA